MDVAVAAPKSSKELASENSSYGSNRSADGSRRLRGGNESNLCACIDAVEAWRSGTGSLWSLDGGRRAQRPLDRNEGRTSHDGLGSSTIQKCRDSGTRNPGGGQKQGRPLFQVRSTGGAPRFLPRRAAGNNSDSHSHLYFL